MAHGRLWPAHPKPLQGELLSSWIVRVAQANGIKLQTLSWILFGNALSPWNRDIDRSAPKWLLKAMSEHTGVNYWDAYHTTLTTYRTILYPNRRCSGQLRWILPVRTYAMNRKGYGQQFCPLCLAEDLIPYFRKTWRVALFTFCPKHQIILHDACPFCGVPVVFHRSDFGVEQGNTRPIFKCYACGFDFRAATTKRPVFPSDEIRELFGEMLALLEMPVGQATPFNLGFFAVLHRFCCIMGSRQNDNRLRNFITNRLQIELTEIELGRTCIEHRRVAERYDLILCALWLLASPTERIREVWEARAVRYNLMLKGINESPQWFWQLAERCSDWRQGYRAR
ncbi:MAG: TniQ family protein [Candidatus Accumulibacter sp.]|nr:TniQ family protein [Accumulibacter sp.]